MSAKTFTLYNHVFFTRKMTDSTIFATQFYKKIFNRYIFVYSLLDSTVLVHAVNRIEAGSQSLMMSA